jgi:hypothetical protein
VRVRIDKFNTDLSSMGSGYLALDEWDFCMVRISDALFKRQLRDDLSSAKAVTALDMIPIIARRPAVRRMVYSRAQQPRPRRRGLR